MSLYDRLNLTSDPSEVVLEDIPLLGRLASFEEVATHEVSSSACDHRETSKAFQPLAPILSHEDGLHQTMRRLSSNGDKPSNGGTRASSTSSLWLALACPRLPSNGGMREWGERASLTRPDRKKRPKNKKLRATQQEKVPIGERIDLRRPEKPKCQVCRRRFQTSWRVCPNCGWILPQEKTKRHCIWVQVGHLEAPETKRQMWAEILADAFSKVFSAFRSVNILLTTDNPDAREWGEDFTQVFVLAEDTSVDYLGIPSFSPGKVAKIFAVRLDRICNASYLADLSLNQLSNLIANTIAHEKS